jgi:hypothetical protein
MENRIDVIDQCLIAKDLKGNSRFVIEVECFNLPEGNE